VFEGEDEDEANEDENEEGSEPERSECMFAIGVDASDWEAGRSAKVTPLGAEKEEDKDDNAAAASAADADAAS